MKYLFLIFFLVSCGSEEVECVFNGCPKPENPEAEEMVTPEQKDQLRAMSVQIRSWTLKCEGGIACGDDSSGDSMLWAGMLCSSGDVSQCNAVRQSQDSITGQLYRNPGGSRGVNDSSRDMLLGFLSYLVATKDQGAANRLVDYLQNNDHKLCNNATDNRCNVGTVQHAALWGTMKRAWVHIGLKPTWEMEQGDLGDETIINLQSKFAFEGYPMHLIGVELQLRQSTNTFTETLQSAADSLLSRQPNNPFFEMIAKGKTKRAAEITLEKCPKQQPATRNQWAWQRAESEQAWLDSKGWDCLFMANILVR